MSKVKITGHASGSGTLTLSAPNTSSDRTITLPDETGTVALGVGISDSADATAITIDSSENVGIGVVPESWSSVYSALQIGGTGVLFSNTDVGTGKSMYITQNAYNDGSWKYQTTDEAARYQSVNGTHKFSVAASGSADAAISFSTALGIKNNQTIYGCEATDQVSSSGFSIQYNDTSNNAAWIENTATSNHGRCLRLQLATDYDNISSYFMYMVGDATARAIIYSDGDMVNHDNSYGSISDERIKQNITDANSQWADIKALKVRNYKKIDDVNKYGSDAKAQIGLIAQEAELVSPGLIKEGEPSSGDIVVNSEFGTLYTADDVETQGDEPTAKVGEVKTVDSQVKSIQYSVLYMKAIKALQEAMARIETLEAKVTALEGQERRYGNSN